MIWEFGCGLRRRVTGIFIGKLSSVIPRKQNRRNVLVPKKHGPL